MFTYLTRSFVVEKKKDVPSHAYQTGVSCGPPSVRLTPTMALFAFESSFCISSEVIVIYSPILNRFIKSVIIRQDLPASLEIKVTIKRIVCQVIGEEVTER